MFSLAKQVNNHSQAQAHNYHGVNPFEVLKVQQCILHGNANMILENADYKYMHLTATARIHNKNMNF